MSIDDPQFGNNFSQSEDSVSGLSETMPLSEAAQILRHFGEEAASGRSMDLDGHQLGYAINLLVKNACESRGQGRDLIECIIDELGEF